MAQKEAITFRCIPSIGVRKQLGGWVAWYFILEISMYLHSHLVQTTSKNEMPHKDTVAWNAMLAGYSQLGLRHEVVYLFQCMRISNAKFDHFTFTARLSACAGIGELRRGTIVHAQMILSGCQSSLPVNYSFIDMHGKSLSALSERGVFEEMSCRSDVSRCSLLFAYVSCGMLDVQHEVFDGIPKRVKIAWNIMTSGHGQFGDVELCLGLFKKMGEDSLQPQFNIPVDVATFQEKLDYQFLFKARPSMWPDFLKCHD